MQEKSLTDIFTEQSLPHYVSEYLTHWTGKNKSDEAGFLNLKSIVESQTLLLSYCPHFFTNESIEANIRMVCFTDIPHNLSENHCLEYGRFGIVFNKSRLKKHGANPVLYLTNENKHIATEVYKFICKLSKNGQEESITSSLKSFFGYVQDCTSFESNKDLYYEREWRILENSLELEQNKEIYPGKKKKIEDEYFFQFAKDDIEFIVCPNGYVHRIAKFFQNKIIVYENYISN